ncbi:MAG: histidinol dehydrogenase [Xanthomonadales bacterium PRO6]|nr:histidinol dehydrogenase [Xanthomonadales bacterium PRO6]
MSASEAIVGLKRLNWRALDEGARAAALARPPATRSGELLAAVARIVEQVRADGDEALRALTRRHDGCELGEFAVSAEEFAAAEGALDAELKRAIDDSRRRIERFHRETRPQPIALSTAPGVMCERLPLPVPRVGLYVPAGSAPLPSTALMLCVPARLAGCRQVVLCTPPRKDGSADPAVLWAARACGVERVYKLGGAQAIAAMAFGTASVPRCDKLYGPGNAYVTAAKLLVSQQAGGAAIDMPAGPSEVLVIADGIADAEFVAADLLSQAEHGADSQALLVTPSVALIDAVDEALRELLAELPRNVQARAALAHSRAILVADLDAAVAVANDYAPEHLILNVADPRRLLLGVESAGSVFLGRYTPESLGDYTSGTNHVLPTDGHARTLSGLSVQSFQKLVTVQEASAEGLKAIGPTAIALAQAEGLTAHALAVQLRLRAIASEGRP